MQGFYKRILTVNMTNRSFNIEPVDDAVLETCLGGRGLATRLLLDRNPAGVDPFAAVNNLIITTGPFCGGVIWGGSRYGVYTKSPLTGYYTESYSGGKVPEAIDAAGYDAVIITGKGNTPTVLTITPERVMFHDAPELWGTDTIMAEELAVENYAEENSDYRKKGAIVIGPAGENLVRFAIIANDKWRCAGRTGTGAVLGSKMVKAIVFQGGEKRQYADQQGVAEYSREFMKTNREHPGVKAYKKLGTTLMVNLMNHAGALPTRYWNEGRFEDAEQISGEKLHAEHQVKPHACAKCFMACGRMTRIMKGRHKDLKIEGPEYETLYSFGSLCMIREVEEVAYLNDLCDRLGMDTISAGNLCGLLMEGKTLGRTEYDIDYGNADQTIELVKAISAREGVGEILADGIIRASKEFNLEDIAVHVKGLEPAGYEPRKLKGMGLAFATSPRGACHLRTTFYKPELSGMIAPEQIEEKAEMLIDFEDRLCLFDTLILCRFYRDLYSWEELQRLLNLVTGKDYSVGEWRNLAAEIITMIRQFNLREGLTPEEERLPGKLTKQVLPDGEKLTAEEMEYMLRDYFRLRGWIGETDAGPE